MSEETSNAQATPDAATVTPPVSAGPTAEELQARIAELERQSEGRLRDLQKERQARQEYEARLAASAQAVPAANEPTDEVEKLIDPILKKRLAPTIQKAELAEKELQAMKVEKAWGVLEKELGKSRKELEADTALQERLMNISQKWGLQGDIVSLTERSIELMKYEDMKAQEAERKRTATIASSQPLAGGTPPAPTNSREYSADAFNRMSPDEFDKLSQKGTFKKVGDKFVFTPR